MKKSEMAITINRFLELKESDVTWAKCLTYAQLRKVFDSIQKLKNQLEETLKILDEQPKQKEVYLV